ncbi:VOC family protein [Marinigracilibium pacificum]|uniref:VOC domain-containing protein n=1 Tax=Marinigracilibium pacificum TaxID=2729599 RepID=A0A848IX98_9BACT|nr:VOC family protein [Marinigracilibium pacificum]NMM47788.1 hypothetical protein [Marinigracilibium pacificum]
MKIEHLAIWVKDLELMKDFYIKYFNMISNKKYHNPDKNFNSYFLNFPESSVRIELMTRPDIKVSVSERSQLYGLTHFVISTGSRTNVDNLTEILRKDGFTIISEPRTTGDGYYESVISDPEGNHIEITV